MAHGDDLPELRTARARWLEWLDGDEIHSINGQLSQLLWNDTVFRVFNEARRLADKGKGAAAISPILATFLDQGYVGGIVLGVTKLTEKSDPKHPKKGVISLRRLVDDLIANKGLLTRFNYLAIDGYPFDYAPVRDAQLAPLLAQENPEGILLRGGGEPAQDWMAAERTHGQFDKLSGVAPAHRSPDDRVSDALLDRLSAALDDDVFERIRTVRHKVIAHAADAHSRQQAADRKGLSFDDADRALRLLLSVRQVAQASILNDSWRAGAIPVPQYDQFQHLDKAFVDPAGIEELHKFWERHTKERDDWLLKGHAELLG
jgi:hypothetical protein